LLSYLAVAHFGRGRGEFVQVAVPDHVQQALGAIVKYRAEFERAWLSARKDRDVGRVEALLIGPLSGLSRDVLVALYPEGAGVLSGPDRVG
jgi:hypothetical protein